MNKLTFQSFGCQMEASQTQTDLWPSIGLTIDEVAFSLHVSTASVRNWIKAGHLNLERSGRISHASFNFFKETILGKDKLTARANKSRLDTHDHRYVQDEFLKLANDSQTKNLDCLGEEYQNALSNSHRNKEGIYYTPNTIIEQLFEFIEGDVSSLVFCDPCCGSGNFIVAALNRGFLPQNIYGYDVDPVAVEITKARIKQFAGFESENIQTLDFLENFTSFPDCKIPQFDVVLTNPPWGKKIDSKAKERFSASYKCPRSTDTAALFIRAVFANASKGARLGFLLPDSFFNISTFSPTRELVLRHKIRDLYTCVTH